MMDPALEMRRLAGKFALFLAGVYVLVMFVVMVAVSRGIRLAVVEWLLLPLPAFAYAPSVVDAVRLHRTVEATRMKILWRRSLGLAVLGTVLLFAEAAVVERVS